MSIGDVMRRIGDILIDRGLITEGQLHDALDAQKDSGDLLGEVLVDLGHITEDKLTQVKASIMGLKIIQIRNMKIHPKLISFIPGSFARRYRMVPAYIENVNGSNVLYMGVSDEPSGAIISSISKKLKIAIRLVLVTPSDLRAVMNHYYPEEAKKDLIPVKPVAPKLEPEPEEKIDLVNAIPVTLESVVTESLSLDLDIPSPVVEEPAPKKKSSPFGGGKLNFLAAFEGDSIEEETPIKEEVPIEVDTPIEEFVIEAVPEEKVVDLFDSDFPFETEVPEIKEIPEITETTEVTDTIDVTDATEVIAIDELSLGNDQGFSMDFEFAPLAEPLAEPVAEPVGIPMVEEEEETVELSFDSPITAPIDVVEKPVEKIIEKPIAEPVEKRIKPIAVPQPKTVDGKPFLDTLLETLETQSFTSMQRAILKQTLTKKDARNALLMATMELLYKNGLLEADHFFDLIKKYVK